MPYLSLDHCVVYASLLLTLIVGLRAGRGIKTIREYAIANKMYGVSVLLFTYLATNFGGSDLIYATDLVFSDGIISTLALTGFAIAHITTALFIAPRVVYFDGCFTIGDLMKTLYGSYSGIIAGILGLLSALLLVGMEFVALGAICEALLDIKTILGILIGGLLLAIYTAHGGIKAVITTDVLQFLTLLVGVPMIAYIAVYRAGGLVELFSHVPKEKVILINHEKFSFYLIQFLTWSIFPVFLIDPALVQRLLMGKTQRQLRNQYLLSATFELIFKIIILLIGLAGIILYPTRATNSNMVLHIIHEFLPIGIKGISIAGLLAVVISTADSYLHVAGLTAVHDIIKPLCDQRGIILSSAKEKKWAQIATLGIGTVAIGIGLCTTDMFGLLLDSLEATGPILLFPFITGIMGLKPEKKPFIRPWASQWPSGALVKCSCQQPIAI